MRWLLFFSVSIQIDPPLFVTRVDLAHIIVFFGGNPALGFPTLEILSLTSRPMRFFRVVLLVLPLFRARGSLLLPACALCHC